MEAQYRLGGIYLEGRLGKTKDVNHGLFWYERAAEQYHVDAFYDLGYIWSNGLAGIRNIEKVSIGLSRLHFKGMWMPSYS